MSTWRFPHNILTGWAALVSTAVGVAVSALGCGLGDLPTESDEKDAPYLRADRAFFRALQLSEGQSLDNRVEAIRQIYLDGTSTLVENYVRHRLDEGDVRVGARILLEYVDAHAPFFDELQTYFESQDPEPDVRQAVERVATLAARSSDAQIIFFVGTHRVNAFVDAGRVGIALEWFLPVGSSANLTLDTQARSSVARAGGFSRMPIWAAHEFTHTLGDLALSTVLDVVINEGIAVLASQLALPEKPLHEHLGYDPGELEWARANERLLWQDFLRVQDSTAVQWIQAYTTDNAKLYEGGPGRIGYYIGYRVAESYVHIAAGLPTLIRETSARSILDRSGYVP